MRSARVRSGRNTGLLPSSSRFVKPVFRHWARQAQNRIDRKKWMCGHSCNPVLHPDHTLADLTRDICGRESRDCIKNVILLKGLLLHDLRCLQRCPQCVCRRFAAASFNVSHRHCHPAMRGKCTLHACIPENATPGHFASLTMTDPS